MPTLKGWVESAWKEISEGLASKHEKEAQNPYTGICKGVTTGRESWANRLPKLLTLQSILLRGEYYYYLKVRAQCLKYNPFWPWHVVFNKQPFDWLRKRIWVFDQKWMKFSKNFEWVFSPVWCLQGNRVPKLIHVFFLLVQQPYNWNTLHFLTFWAKK